MPCAEYKHDNFGVRRTNTPDYSNREFIQNPQGNTEQKYTHTAAAAAFCSCGNPVGLKLQWKSAEYKHDKDDTVQKLLRDETVNLESLSVTYEIAVPAPQNTELKHLPDEIAGAYRQAIQNMNMEGCEEAAVIMFRRTLETTIRKQYPKISGRNLKEKIDALESQKIIPDSMKTRFYEKLGA